MPQSPIASLCLQPEIKELLINAVKTRPAIWDIASDEYSDSNARRRAYLEVAEILGKKNNCQYKPAEIQVEWKKMRDVFNRTLKKVMQSEGKYEIGWRYFDQIKFIASPEQQMFLQQKDREYNNDSPIDLYRQFLENTASNENFSLFKNSDEPTTTDPETISLDWIAARCAKQQEDSACTKNDESSSYDEPITAQNTANDDRVFLSRKRQRTHSNSSRSLSQHKDTFDAFGAFVASHLRSVSKRSRLAGANLQRSVLEICLKSELEN